MLATNLSNRSALLRDLPMKRPEPGEEISDAVLRLCSSASSFVTGQALAVDDGFTVY
jgi:NAD(P)-dependent dehydrogenase (short-subunit alcohol dehydrogenase family)